MVCLGRTAGATPFRSEKNTNWEGGWRVPAMIRTQPYRGLPTDERTLPRRSRMPLPYDDGW
jgi:arylsulfatase A-like enzyme